MLEIPLCTSGQIVGQMDTQKIPRSTPRFPLEELVEHLLEGLRHVGLHVPPLVHPEPVAVGILLLWKVGVSLWPFLQGESSVQKQQVQKQGRWQVGGHRIRLYLAHASFHRHSIRLVSTVLARREIEMRA